MGTTLEIKGKTCTVNPLTIQQIVRPGGFSECGLELPRKADDLGLHQYRNLEDENRRQQVDKWLQETVFYEGQPVTLMQALEWGWDMTDLGRWLDAIAQTAA